MNMVRRKQSGQDINQQPSKIVGDIPADWLLLGLPVVEGYGAMLDMPKELAAQVVPGSITFDTDFAVLANTRLADSGHEPEIRSVVEKFLNKGDLGALWSLVNNMKKDAQNNLPN